MSAVVFSSCTKEPMLGPDPSFTTSLKDATAKEATAYAGEPFYVKVNRGNSEFFALFSGISGSEYGVLGAQGKQYSITTDSLSVTYNDPGVYNLVILASSAGNQAADYKQKADSIKVTVLDRRTGFSSFIFYSSATETVTGLIKETEEGNTIEAGAADYPDRNYTSKPTFRTVSPEAEVYWVKDGVETRIYSAQSDVDFSNAEEEPVVLRVKSPHGVSADYYAKLKKEEPSSAAVISFIQTMQGSSVLDVTTRTLIPGSVPERYALDFVCYKTNKTGRYRMNINSSYASIVKVCLVTTSGGVTSRNWYVYSPTVTYSISTIETIRVIPQNVKDSIDYEFKLFDPLEISFQFTEGKDGVFNPPVKGAVDLAAKTITFFMSKSGYGDNFKALKAKWQTTATKVVVDGVEVESEVTTFDFSGSDKDEVRKKKFSFFINYTPTDFDVIINLTE